MTARSLPPGPRAPWPVQLFRYMNAPLALFERCAARFGDIFTLDLGPMGRWVFVCSPDLIKEMYLVDPASARAGEAKAGLFGAVLGTTSVLVLDGDAHLRRRRLLLPAFRGERMPVYTDSLVELIAAELNDWPQGEWFSAHERLQRVALRAALLAVFGDRMDPRLPAQFTRFADEAVGSRLLMMPFLQRDLGRFSPWRRILDVVRDTDALLHAEIARRRAEGGPGGEDILSLLLQVRDEDGRPLSDQELRDEVATLLTAGHETTAISLAWALASIVPNREVCSRITAELDRVLAGRPLDRANVSSLEYLDAAIKESLRHNSTVANGSARRLSASVEIGGYLLPPGTMLTSCMHLLHHRPDLYPDPEVFRPERFLERRPGPYEWIPFGGGVRRCLGMAFALHEMKLVLALLLSTLRLELALPSRAVRRGMFLMPEGGPRIRVLTR